MTMHFAKSSPEMIALFDQVAPDGPPVERRKMFGYPCFFVNGNLAGGLHGDNFLLRLSVDDRTALLELGGKVFEPMAGRPMKEYILVPDTITSNQTQLKSWITRSIEYALTLPPKAKRGS